MTAFTLNVVQQLKDKLNSQRDGMDEQLSTRLHRAISWLQSAEESSNSDMEFIALWISFSACCAIDQQGDQPLGHHDQFVHFIEQLVILDGEKRIYSCLWEEYSGHVKALIRNPYVFHDFWVSKREGDDLWKAKFDQSSIQALNALSRQRVAELCSIVLDRLFVLRNQLVYGGATYKGRVNRDQVEDGAGLLGTLVPIMIEVMLSADQEHWGDIAYPVINN
jgi:hypothetical protein